MRGKARAIRVWRSGLKTKPWTNGSCRNGRERAHADAAILVDSQTGQLKLVERVWLEAAHFGFVEIEIGNVQVLFLVIAKFAVDFNLKIGVVAHFPAKATIVCVETSLTKKLNLHIILGLADFHQILHFGMS